MGSERERILALEGGNLDREVAEKVMGWVIETHDKKPPHFHRTSDKTHWTWLQEWCPSEDHNAVRAMEDEIERRGLLLDYLAQVRLLAAPEPNDDDGVTAAILRTFRASAADRCRAALLTVGATPLASSQGK